MVSQMEDPPTLVPSSPKQKKKSTKKQKKKSTKLKPSSPKQKKKLRQLISESTRLKPQRNIRSSAARRYICGECGWSFVTGRCLKAHRRRENHNFMIHLKKINPRSEFLSAADAIDILEKNLMSMKKDAIDVLEKWMSLKKDEIDVLEKECVSE